jgi:hypothetical protein
LTLLAEPIHLFNAKPSHVVRALFEPGVELGLDPETGQAFARWGGGRFAGDNREAIRGEALFAAPLLGPDELEMAARGELRLPEFEDDPGSDMWVTIRRGQLDEAMWGRAEAFMAAVFELHGKEGAWCLERAVELFHGPRKPRRSRARQTPVFRALERLFSSAWFRLDGGRDNGPNSGVVTGRLLTVERSGRYGTVRLNEGWHKLLSTQGVAFSMVSPEILRLNVKGHHNPYGNKPSLARRLKHRVSVVFFARGRQHRAKKGGELQKVSPDVFYRDWVGIDPAEIERNGRMNAYLDTLEEDLALVAACGGPSLIAPIDRNGKPRFSWICLRLAPAVREAAAGWRESHRKDKPRGGRKVQASPSGRPNSHAPPG